jgi:hypothetical protein
MKKPKKEVLLKWKKEKCGSCPYHMRNFKNSINCDGSFYSILKKCVFWRDEGDKFNQENG